MTILDLYNACATFTTSTRFVVLRKWKDEREHADLIFVGNYIDMPHDVYTKKIKSFSLVMDRDTVTVTV